MADQPAAPAAAAAGERNQFGTFGGVFTPSILTILGLIMFMRAGFVVGQAGILGAMMILLLAEAITGLTALSVCAVGTNMQVRGGGAYFLISRVLGPEFGGAIGIALYFAQALSVPFYILGFSEALVRAFPNVEPHFLVVTLTTGAILFALTYVGASYAIKAQYFIMAVVFLSIVALIGGAMATDDFSYQTFRDNLGSAYGLVEGSKLEGARYSFWVVFAIYFPAVTGILTGINMSGDLKDPSRSIPVGTLAAVGVGFLIYLAEMLVLGAAFQREELVARPFDILQENALFGLSFLIVAGVFAATVSSAIGSYMGAPRVLQAVARDRIIRFLGFFAKGTAKGDEPRRGLILTGALTVAVLLWAGNDAGGSSLNAVAAIITMFFLYTYGMINMAAFTEAYSGNPSFRPRFRWFHWLTALGGGVGCVSAAFLINAEAAAAALAVLAGLLWWLRRKALSAAFGDARRGFVYTQLRRSLLRLGTMEEDSKNWRPTILVFSGNPASRETLVTYAVWLEAGRGIVFLANILVGDPRERERHRLAAINQLRLFCRENDVQAFPVAVVGESLEAGVVAILQTAGVGTVRPNLCVFGWPGETAKLEILMRHLRLAYAMGMSLVLIRDRGVPVPNLKKRIDLWWRGHRNGDLMILLAHLLTRNWEWSGSRIRVLRVVEREEGRAPARQALEQLLERARVDGEAEVIASDQPFVEILQTHSRDAACVILGFEMPEYSYEGGWRDFYEHALDNMPTAILVSSRGEEDVLV